jgi:hypothetical protein
MTDSLSRFVLRAADYACRFGSSTSETTETIAEMIETFGAGAPAAGRGF